MAGKSGKRTRGARENIDRDVEYDISDAVKMVKESATANFDETVFENPGEIRLDRKPNPHVAFGGYGTHHCLGASLARLELRIMFEELVRRMPDLELATEDPLPQRASNFITGIEAMPVRFTPSKPALEEAG